MAAVRDPNFWHRFSVAVHQDDAQREQIAQRPQMKHSYVSPISASEAHSPVTTPTSQSPLSPGFHAMYQPHPQQRTYPQPPSPVALGPLAPPAPSHPGTPTTPTMKRQPSKLQKQPLSTTRSKSISASVPPMSPRSPRRPSLAHNPFTRHGNGSQLTLGLSGRPQSRFKFWTSVTADPSNRDSWLESQRKKQKQRTWMCWSFWILFALLVAGVVVCILLLKANKII